MEAYRIGPGSDGMMGSRRVNNGMSLSLKFI